MKISCEKVYFSTKYLFLWYIVKRSQLTHIRSCTKARFPRDDAKCSGDLASLGLTDELTSSELQCAKTSATVLISDLKIKIGEFIKEML